MGSMAAIRWLLLLPAALAAWWGVFVLAVAAYFYVNGQCPDADMVRGLCMNRSIINLLQTLTHSAAALSAVAVLVATTLVAPSRKEAVVWLTLAIGLVVAGYFAVSLRAWSFFLSAAAGGVVAAAAIAHRLDRRAAN